MKAAGHAAQVSAFSKFRYICESGNEYIFVAVGLFAQAGQDFCGAVGAKGLLIVWFSTLGYSQFTRLTHRLKKVSRMIFKSKNSSSTASPATAPHKLTNAQATRETVESIVVAVILAFLFRTFVAEAFVIPTGSMAPTLEGNHKDLTCSKCGYQYQASASAENEDSPFRNGPVVAATCPVCRYTTTFDLKNNPYHRTFTGDRILVSKFSYDLGDPQRWDVIVFKYPGNAKQNYIKRLVGLPNETLRVRHGDIYTKGAQESEFHIARKPPHKIKATLQVVDDTRYIANELMDANWPSRWQPATSDSTQRLCKDDAQGFAVEGPLSAEPTWMRYRHFTPTETTWQSISKKEPNVRPDPEFTRGRLITDYYAYNSYSTEYNRIPPNGLHWVGDLALECDVDVKSASGELWLDLVEGGVHYQVAIDIASGKATASILGGKYSFAGKEGEETSNPTGATSVRGAGRHRFRLSNLDNELVLWVDESVVKFDRPLTYESDPDARPVTSAEDLGDLAPAGIGAKGAQLHVRQARILRDVYYIATRDSLSMPTDYEGADFHNNDSRGERVASVVNRVLNNPSMWESSKLFQLRRAVSFEMLEDQFFPMGDNSPQSSDARMWGRQHYVERELLTGKAVLVYWPHALPRPIPIIPNVARMRLIR